MLTERDAIKRESSALLSSVVADEQLASAMMTIEELTVKLSDQQRNHQQQVNDA